MRGKVYSPKPLSRYDGITPAYAGKRFTNPSVVMIIKDHPRLCGEKPVDHGDSVHSRGSPPPMRGKGSRRKIRTRSKRITPAYAGKRRIAVGTAALN